jgi:hypothetical protein
MNQHVKRFFLIFCLIGVAICAFLAVVNASQSPAATQTAVVFAVVGVVLAAGAVGLRSRSQI